MTDEHPSVPVDWDLVQPGDHVVGPQGGCWVVVAVLDVPGDPVLSFLIEREDRPGDGVWTDRPRGQIVKGWRFSDSPKIPGAEAFAIGRLRLAGMNVTEIEEVK